MTDNTRERLTIWPDTDVYRPWLQGRNGLDYLNALVDGTLPNPPFFELLGFRLTAASDGAVTVEAETGEHLYNPACVIHGGFVATLLDTVTALAVRSRIPPDKRMTSVEIKVNFIRPLFKDSGRLICKGQVVHMGRRFGIADGEVRNAQDKLISRATATIAVMDREGGNEFG